LIYSRLIIWHFIGAYPCKKGMMKNYLKFAWRTLTRNKGFSAINIFGLSLGIATSLMILLWVRDERAMDAFHANGPHLFQVYERTIHDGKTEAGYPTQGLLAVEMKRVIPDVQYAAAFDYGAQPGTKNTLRVNDQITKMTGFYAGEDFFRMFSFPVLQGTAATALQAPGDIAVSRSLAAYFFGSPEAAIGKTILFEDKETLRVTAVFENVPLHSSLQFDFLRSGPDYVKQNDWVNNWGNESPSSFVQLRAGADPERVEAKIKDFLGRYTQKIKGMRTELALQPFPERYLHSTFKDGRIDGGRIEYVRLFTGVAIFILLIACINFMNLATAQAAKRAREVGLRKVIGAARSSLIFQFMGEALLLTSLSVLVALVVARALLPAFNDLTGKQLSLPLQDPFFMGMVLAILVTTALTAGSYPALFLSSLQPVKVLKGFLQFDWKSTALRKGLVVFQFTLSIVLMIGMMVVRRQVDYIQTMNLGYDRTGLVYIPIEGTLAKEYPTFKEEASKLTGITAIAKMRNSPTIIEHHTGSIDWPGKDPNLHLSFADGVVGYDFVHTMKLQLKEGRDFSPLFSSDSAGFLLNETAVNSIGLQHPLGATLFWGNRRGKVIGVLKDFHFNSLHQTIDPLIVRLDENWNWGTILVRIESGKAQEALAGLQKLCKEINPEFPLTYQFSDLEFARLYKSEEIVSHLTNVFAFLAILISSLGLFGLATFTAAQRTKEIGVRKVLGASSRSIAFLLTGEFLKIVAVAIFIAYPVAWFIMSEWLQQYAYKVGISWWAFAGAGLATFFIAMLTVSYQSIRAAVINPVDSLRSQ
jgi:putative ABC transport system permease protein